jgi:hypothetical protein
LLSSLVRVGAILACVSIKCNLPRAEIETEGESETETGETNAEPSQHVIRLNVQADEPHMTTWLPGQPARISFRAKHPRSR